MRKMRVSQGLTLIELLVVMAVIGILAGLIVAVGPKAINKARAGKAQSMISALGIAISMYHTDTGQYPPDSDAGVTPNTPIAVVYDHLTNETDLAPGAGARAISGWSGPYMEFKDEDLSGGEVVDPWGQGYWYDSSSPSNNAYSYDLWSIGADGTNGTNDDVINW